MKENSLQNRLSMIVPAPDIFVVSALLVSEDGRYLLQLRDDKINIPLPNHWALFGGSVEAGEGGKEAIIREIKEELKFSCQKCTWYHEAVYILPLHYRQVVRKSYYLIPILTTDIFQMELCEGAGMKLMHLDEIISLPNIAPWDLAVMMMHSREKLLFVS